MKRATSYGITSDAKLFLYNSNNKISRIESKFSYTVINYFNNFISTITSNGRRESIEYNVSINTNMISLVSTNHIIEIDYNNGYIDAYRSISQNPTQFLAEYTFTRNSDNNIISLVSSTSTSNTIYNYSNYDDKNCTLTYNSFNVDLFSLIFNLKPSKNNPLTAEYIYNNGNPSIINYTLLYDDNDNVTQLNQTAIEIKYEYIEL